MRMKQGFCWSLLIIFYSPNSKNKLALYTTTAYIRLYYEDFFLFIKSNCEGTFNFHIELCIKSTAFQVLKIGHKYNGHIPTDGTTMQFHTQFR